MRPLLTLSLLAALAAGADAAKLKNDGFETGDLSAWQLQGEGWRPTSWGRDSHRGIWGAVNDVWTNALDEYRVLRQEVKAAAGKTYQASAWLRAVCVESTESFLEIQFLDDNGNVLRQFQSEHVSRDQEFKLMTIGEMPAPENTKRASVRGVVRVLSRPEVDTDFHVFDNFDFRQQVIPRAAAGRQAPAGAGGPARAAGAPAEAADAAQAPRQAP